MIHCQLWEYLMYNKTFNINLKISKKEIIDNTILVMPLLDHFCFEELEEYFQSPDFCFTKDSPFP